MAQLSSRIDLVGPVPKGRCQLSWTNHHCGRNLNSFIRTKLEMSGSITILLVQGKCALHNVIIIVAYNIDGVIMHLAVPRRQTVNAAYYCTFLQHHLRPALRRKRQHLVVHNPNILQDNARSHTAAAATDLLRRCKGRLTRYESMRLRSLRQSERTTVRDPVQHKRWTYPCYRAVNTEHQQRWTRWWCMTLSKHLAKRDE